MRWHRCWTVAILAQAISHLLEKTNCHTGAMTRREFGSRQIVCTSDVSSCLRQGHSAQAAQAAQAVYDVAIHVRAADAVAASAAELTEDVDIQRSHHLCNQRCLPTRDLPDVPVKYIVSFDNVDAVYCSLCGVSICE